MFDVLTWRSDLRATVTEICELKAIRRESGQPRFDDRVSHRLLSLKAEATRLCFFRANLRGRKHSLPKHWPISEAEKILAKLSAKYLIPVLHAQAI